MREFEPLRAAVQHNCHISDARHGQQDTLCVYLLKMRELYRWEHGLAPGEPLPREEIGRWIQGRERLWESLEEREFTPLEVADQTFGPFEAESINRALEGAGLVYSAGYGRHAKPSFFLGQLEGHHRELGFEVFQAGRELARDLAAPPAMLQGETIFLRRESLRRLIWEKVEENGGRPDHPIRRAMKHWRFDGGLSRALEAMTDHELRYALAHELGEGLTGRRLGPAWERLVLNRAGSRDELIARAVRDKLADSLTTLPRLLEAGDLPSIHFYFANHAGLRKELDPRLEEGYHRLVESGSPAALEAAAADGEAYWSAAARRLLELEESDGWQGCDCLVEELKRK